jgi:hypothetical protein
VITDRRSYSNRFRREFAGNNNIAIIQDLRNRQEETVYDEERYKKRGWKIVFLGI